MRLSAVVPEAYVSEHTLNPFLEGVTRVNERMLAEGKIPTFDEAVKSGIRWKPEPLGQGYESFDNGETVIRRGNGDCDDLAPYAAATMRASGEDPGARAVVRRSGPTTWHAYVLTSDGKERDPSVEAGMGRKGLQGVCGAAVPPMFPAVVGDDEPRAHIALRRIITPRGQVGFDARVDIPLTDTDFAISTLERRGVASQAIIGAIMGGVYTAEAIGSEHDDMHAKLYAIAGLLSGDDPRDLARVFGRSAVVGAIPFLQTAASELGFDFGKFVKSLAPIAKVLEPVASTALSFIPGVGPIASRALDLTSAALANPAKMAKSVLDAASATAAQLIPSGGGLQFQVYPGAHIAPAS